MKKLFIFILFYILLFSTVFAEPIFKKDSTSQLIEVFISDSSSTTGGGLTGLVYNSAGLTAYYYCSGTTATSITLATMTVGTWATGGFIQIDATNMPGWYQFGIPNAALVSGCGSDVNLHLKGATNMVPLPFAISLVDNLEVDTYAKVDAEVAAILDDTGTSGVVLANDAITAAKIQDGAITPVKEYIASGTEGAGNVSTTLKVYTSLSNNTRRYVNMCMESATGERSRITGYGSNFFNVRGFAVAPTDGSALKIYDGGCL